MALPVIIAAAAVAKGILDLAKSYSESKALDLQAEGNRLRGQWQKAHLETNARLADLAAEDAVGRGEQEASAISRAASELRGEQRAQYAAQGVELGSGSAALVQQETQFFSELDMITARSNAYQEAFGYKVQAADFRHRGRMAEFEGANEAFLSEDKARATLLTGGINFGSSIASAASEFDGPVSRSTSSSDTLRPRGSTVPSGRSWRVRRY